MIELIYNEEGEAAAEEKELWEPKNIRQVGEPEENRKILIEDYVHTFLQQYGSAEDGGNGRVAVLLGKCERSGSRKYFYVKSALAVEEIAQKEGKYEFSETVWGKIYRECGQYFFGQDILGWFLARPGFPVGNSRLVEETQKTYFSGADKIFMMCEPLEGETAFFAFRQNFFERQDGYYIYYEKNEPMQEYMLARRQEQGGGERPETTERAVASFRRILQEKQEVNVKKKKRAAVYSVRAGVFVLLFSAGAVIWNRWKETDFSKLREAAAGEVGAEDFAEYGVVVEELTGDVDAQEENVPQEMLPLGDEGAETGVEEVPENAEDTEMEEPVENAVDTGAEEQPENAEEAGTKEQPENAEEAAAPVSEEYTVQRGDTLAGIVRAKYGDLGKIGEICELNGIADGDYIQEGEIILLP